LLAMILPLLVPEPVLSLDAAALHLQVQDMRFWCPPCTGPRLALQSQWVLDVYRMKKTHKMLSKPSSLTLSSWQWLSWRSAVRWDWIVFTITTHFKVGDARCLLVQCGTLFHSYHRGWLVPRPICLLWKMLVLEEKSQLTSSCIFLKLSSRRRAPLRKGYNWA
jgi:hypothetical protein